jgi:hypothetical protein
MGVESVPQLAVMMNYVKHACRSESPGGPV